MYEKGDQAARKEENGMIIPQNFPNSYRRRADLIGMEEIHRELLIKRRNERSFLSVIQI